MEHPVDLISQNGIRLTVEISNSLLAFIYLFSVIMSFFVTP